MGVRPPGRRLGKVGRAEELRTRSQSKICTISSKVFLWLAISVRALLKRARRSDLGIRKVVDKCDAKSGE